MTPCSCAKDGGEIYQRMQLLLLCCFVILIVFSYNKLSIIDINISSSCNTDLYAL